MVKKFKLRNYQIIVSVCYLLTYVFFFSFNEKSSRVFSFAVSDLPVFFTTLVIALICLYFANIFFNLGKIGFAKVGVRNFLLILFYSVFIIALPEEIIFRAILQDYFSSIFDSSTLAIFLSSIVYGLAHLANRAEGLGVKKWNWKLAGMTFVAGLFLGFLYKTTDSLVLPTILHSILLLLLIFFIQTKKN